MTGLGKRLQRVSVSKKMQATMVKVENLANKWGFKVSVAKTHVSQGGIKSHLFP